MRICILKYARLWGKDGIGASARLISIRQEAILPAGSCMRNCPPTTRATFFRRKKLFSAQAE
jgi:hypothetical protein